MSDVKFYEADDKVTRWVQPFESVPDFQVEMRRLSEAETNRLYDRHKVFPGAPKQSMSRWAALVKDLFSASVVSWKGAHIALGEAAEVECNDENKQRIANVMVAREEDGEPVRESLPQVLAAKFSELEASDSKN